MFLIIFCCVHWRWPRVRVFNNGGIGLSHCCLSSTHVSIEYWLSSYW